jgi:diphosphoinositol-polyphosphate diphosphatase
MGKSNKDRTKQIRTFDTDGYRRRADAIIFRDTTFREVLLVSSRSEPDKWTVVGGGVEPDESGMTTSAREAREEAGVVGTVDSFVGSFDDQSRKTRTEVYILIADRMVETWEDKTEMDRQRRWFPVNEAITITSRRPLKQNYLIAACNLATHRREQLASPPSSPPPPTSSPHFPHSSLHRRSAVLPVALTCMLVCCASAYFVFM